MCACDGPLGRGGTAVGGEPEGDEFADLELLLRTFETGRVLTACGALPASPPGCRLRLLDDSPKPSRAATAVADSLLSAYLE
jgi:hypothetical protein